MKKIVVIGGGAAGSLLCLELSNLLKKTPFELVLVDNKDYMEFTPSIIDALLQPTSKKFNDRLECISPSYARFFKNTNVKVVVEVVDYITATQVVMNGGSTLNYDILVICTGSSYHKPFKPDLKISKFSDRLQELADYRTSVENANSILCIGGGPVGVETVGELAVRYPNKQINLVHNGVALTSQAGEKVSLKIKDVFEKGYSNINLFLNQKAESDDGKTYKTTVDNATIQPDLTIMSSGLKPNSQLMEKEFSSCLDDKKFIKVNDYFQVIGTTNIYAVGDVSNINEPKLYSTAHMQALHLAKNLVFNIKQNTEMGNTPTQPYRGTSLLLVLSLGPDHGVASLFDGKLNITGITSPLIGSNKGSRRASYMKRMIESLSVNPDFAGFVNTALYFTITRWSGTLSS